MAWSLLKKDHNNFDVRNNCKKKWSTSTLHNSTKRVATTLQSVYYNTLYLAGANDHLDAGYKSWKLFKKRNHDYLRPPPRPLIPDSFLNTLNNTHTALSRHLAITFATFLLDSSDPRTQKWLIPLREGRKRRLLLPDTPRRSASDPCWWLTSFLPSRRLNFLLREVRNGPANGHSQYHLN